MTALLKITALRVDVITPAGPRPVISGVELSVNRGEILALVGESGSGKSLTALSVLGLLPTEASASGSIRLGDVEVVGASARVLRSLRGTVAAMVFQDPQTALNPVQTIGRQLREALRAHAHRRGERFDGKAANARSVELLRHVELPDPQTRVHWYPHQLSGGQKQRVVLALALSGDPGLLIADEPTTALDVTVQAEILALLRRLRDSRGTAILIITHNLGVVAELADRVAVLKDGSVVEQAPVDRLFTAPRHAYTRSLLAAVPRWRDGACPPEDAQTERAPVLLTLDDVSLVHPPRRGHPAVHALSGVSFTLHTGEVLGLVGESGSGKTTIGRVVLGLVAPTSGAVLIDGVDLATAGKRELRHVRRGLALVHQDPSASLDPRLTVEDSIAEPIAVRGGTSRRERAERVLELLDAVRLPADFAARRPAELSGGQRQRVALARALALTPRLLVADEPTSALDVSVQATVLELFTELRLRYGFACVFVSHDLAVVNDVAERVGVLRGGRLIETGPVSAVFSHPAEDYTRRLIAAVPIADPVRQRQGRNPVVGGES